MEIKKQLNTILSKKMSREGFLKHVAIGAVAVVGGSTLLKLAAEKSGTANTQVSSAAGYGDAPYGGSSPQVGKHI